MAHIEKRSYITKDGEQTVHWRARYRDPRGRERVRTPKARRPWPTASTRHSAGQPPILLRPKCDRRHR